MRSDQEIAEERAGSEEEYRYLVKKANRKTNKKAKVSLRIPRKRNEYNDDVAE